jgi:transcriptional regulator with XRE-family HTH domain
MKKLHKTTVLKKRRIDHKLSQGDLAAKVGVAISSIGGYERGENPLTIETAKYIAQALETTPESLFKPHPKLKGKYIAK